MIAMTIVIPILVYFVTRLFLTYTISVGIRQRP